MPRFASVTLSSLAAAACGLAAADAGAAVIGVNDFSGSESVMTFDDQFDPEYSKDFGDVTITMLDLTDRFRVLPNDWGGYFTDIPNSSGGHAVITEGFSPGFQIEFETTVYRIGLSLANTPSFSWVIAAYDAAGNALGGDVFTTESDSWSLFAGLEFTTPVARIDVIDSGLGNYSTVFDDVRFEVPEPASLTLLGIGALLVTGRRRLD